MPERAAPTPYDDEIAAIVRARQRAFREVNAFPTHSPLDIDEQQEIIAGLPPLGAPGAIKDRLVAAAYFDMDSLDLTRADNLGDWETGAAIDVEVKDFFTELHGSEALQREMGVVSLSGYIDKDSRKARPESHALSLGSELAEQGVFHVLRMRRIAVLALANSGHPLIVRKRSDFRLGGSPNMPEELAMRAQVVAQGGLRADFLDSETFDFDKVGTVFAAVRRVFAADVEEAIKERSEWLYPINMNHHVKSGD